MGAVGGRFSGRAEREARAGAGGGGDTSGAAAVRRWRLGGGLRGVVACTDVLAHRPGRGSMSGGGSGCLGRVCAKGASV